MNRRGNGFGTLVSKGKGKPWLARWMWKGEVFSKSTGEVDKKKAMKELERLTRPFRERREEEVLRCLQSRIISLKESHSREDLPVEESWEKLKEKLANGDVTASTLHTYETSMNDFMSWMKGRASTLSKVNKKMASEYLAHMSESLGAGAWNNRLSLLKRMWKLLKDDFKLEEGIWEDFKKKKVMKSHRRALTEDEIASALSKSKSFDLKVLIIIGMYTGLRLSDCAMLKWSEVDFSQNVLRVVPIKTRKHMDGPIEIPMHPALRKTLEEAPREGEFVSEENARQYKNETLGRNVVNLFEEIGLETSKKENGKTKLLCSFHSLRHTFVSIALNNNMSPMLVQKIVGHAAVSMTESYFHDNKDKMAEGINAMPDIL